MGELCGLCECMKGRHMLHVVVWWPCLSCEEGARCMWWPWWPWGACRLPMGCVCAVREVRTAYGGHGVCVDYLWVVCVL